MKEWYCAVFETGNMTNIIFEKVRGNKIIILEKNCFVHIKCGLSEHNSPVYMQLVQKGSYSLYVSYASMLELFKQVFRIRIKTEQVVCTCWSNFADYY